MNRRVNLDSFGNYSLAEVKHALDAVPEDEKDAYKALTKDLYTKASRLRELIGLASTLAVPAIEEKGQEPPEERVVAKKWRENELREKLYAEGFELADLRAIVPPQILLENYFLLEDVIGAGYLPSLVKDALQTLSSLGRESWSLSALRKDELFSGAMTTRATSHNGEKWEAKAEIQRKDFTRGRTDPGTGELIAYAYSQFCDDQRDLLNNIMKPFEIYQEERYEGLFHFTVPAVVKSTVSDASADEESRDEFCKEVQSSLNVLKYMQSQLSILLEKGRLTDAQFEAERIAVLDKMLILSTVKKAKSSVDRVKEEHQVMLEHCALQLENLVYDMEKNRVSEAEFGRVQRQYFDQIDEALYELFEDSKLKQAWPVFLSDVKLALDILRDHLKNVKQLREQGVFTAEAFGEFKRDLVIKIGEFYKLFTAEWGDGHSGQNWMFSIQDAFTTSPLRQLLEAGSDPASLKAAGYTFQELWSEYHDPVTRGSSVFVFYPPEGGVMYEGTVLDLMPDRAAVHVATEDKAVHRKSPSIREWLDSLRNSILIGQTSTTPLMEAKSYILQLSRHLENKGVSVAMDLEDLDSVEDLPGTAAVFLLRETVRQQERFINSKLEDLKGQPELAGDKQLKKELHARLHPVKVFLEDLEQNKELCDAVERYDRLLKVCPHQRPCMPSPFSTLACRLTSVYPVSAGSPPRLLRFPRTCIRK